MTAPLADRMRPETLDDVVGQRHILGKDRVLRKIVERGTIPNLIFYGPPGVGKTTVARIISEHAGKKLYHLNGTSASTADLRSIVDGLGGLDSLGGVLLYLDEIQYLNKKQQQSLLEFIEDGSITLIASTTENPYFYIYKAVLSRCTVFEFRSVEAAEIERALERARQLLDKELGGLEAEPGVLGEIASLSGGDVRRALGNLEMLALAASGGVITRESVGEVAAKNVLHHDRDSDDHYDLLSAFHKSMRGSDENAALHYLARLLEAGEMLAVIRRLLACACEDIGLAYPQAIPIVKACTDIALQLGMPEAQLPLSDAAVLLCTSPKSNSACEAMAAAMADVQAGCTGPVPRHLQNVHMDGAEVKVKGQSYLYPHNFPNHYVKQQYLPDNIRSRVYYQFGENKTEQAARQYREKIRGE